MCQNTIRNLLHSTCSNTSFSVCKHASTFKVALRVPGHCLLYHPGTVKQTFKPRVEDLCLDRVDITSHDHRTPMSKLAPRSPPHARGSWTASANCILQASVNSIREARISFCARSPGGEAAERQRQIVIALLDRREQRTLAVSCHNLAHRLQAIWI
jgi:hypothetical protein